MQKLAEKSNVPVKNFNVIYHLIGDLKTELGDRMEPVEVRGGEVATCGVIGVVRVHHRVSRGWLYEKMVTPDVHFTAPMFNP